ncbi:MAG: hypothetical protein PHD72_00490 [Patescibacteria group bacterium]|nr:hypothetical protein [Patescibacteria group bacterium]
MGRFNRDDKSGAGIGNKSFGGGGHFSAKGGFGGGGRKFGGHSDGPRQMFPATCGKCGQSCEVPFKPTGERPVFCNNCFKNRDGGSSGPKFAPRSFGGGRSTGGGGGGVTKEQFDMLNAKLDRILKVLAPNSSAPALAEKSAPKEIKKLAKAAPAKKPAKKATKKKK